MSNSWKNSNLYVRIRMIQSEWMKIAGHWNNYFHHNQRSETLGWESDLAHTDRQTFQHVKVAIVTIISEMASICVPLKFICGSTVATINLLKLVKTGELHIFNTKLITEIWNATRCKQIKLLISRHCKWEEIGRECWPLHVNSESGFDICRWLHSVVRNARK